MAKIKRIHVNQHHIRWNNKNPSEPPKPIISIKCGGKTYTGHKADILGESKVIYQPNNPLSCGARVWVETYAFVQLDGVIIE